MTASQNDKIERYVNQAIETAKTCRTAVVSQLVVGNIASYSIYTSLADHDADWDLYTRVAKAAANRGGDWVTALTKARERCEDELLTTGVERSTNMYSTALSMTRHARLRHFLSESASLI